MKERIGEIFEGTISAVTAFGIFVALDQVYVEGLVHVSDLGADYFQFDPIKHQMLGERTGQRFRLGDRVTVKLVRADLESNKIDFTLLSADGATGVKGRSRSGPASSGGKPRTKQVVAAMPPVTPTPVAPVKVGKKSASRRAAGAVGDFMGKMAGKIGKAVDKAAAGMKAKSKDKAERKAGKKK